MKLRTYLSDILFLVVIQIHCDDKSNEMDNCEQKCISLYNNSVCAEDISGYRRTFTNNCDMDYENRKYGASMYKFID